MSKGRSETCLEILSTGRAGKEGWMRHCQEGNRLNGGVGYRVRGLGMVGEVRTAP